MRCARSPLNLPQFYRLEADSAGKVSAIHQHHSRLFKLGLDSGHRAVEVDGAACIAQNNSFETKTLSVKSGEAHAIVIGKSSKKDAGNALVAQIIAEARRSNPIVLKESGVGIDLRAEAFAQNNLSLRQMERRVKLRALAALNTVVGPQRLHSVAQFDLLEGPPARVSAGKGGVSHRVPILGKNNVVECRGNTMDDIDYRIAIGNGKRAAGAEVVLYVNDYQDILRGRLHGSPANSQNGERTFYAASTISNRKRFPTARAALAMV